MVTKVIDKQQSFRAVESPNILHKYLNSGKFWSAWWFIATEQHTSKNVMQKYHLIDYWCVQTTCINIKNDQESKKHDLFYLNNV